MQNEVNSICPASFSLASDYTLTTGSTAVVDAGLPQSEMPVDLAGWYRASPPEIGAFEEPLTDTPSEVCTYTDGRLATRTMGVKTLSYTYDAAGRLQTFADSSDSGNNITNTYDHLGRRIAMEIGGVEKYRFVYDGEDVIAEYFDSNNDGDVADPDDYKRVYWILPEIDQRVGFLHIQNGTTNFYAYLTDQVGSVLQIVDSSGTVINQYDYDAFGNIRPENTFEGIPNRYTFQGREWDANAGHYYFRNRTYIPEWGCFTGPDMNLGNGILGEPNGIGNYLAFNNNGLRFRDPLGLDYVEVDDKGNVVWVVQKILSYGSGCTGPKYKDTARITIGKKGDKGVQLSDRFGEKNISVRQAKKAARRMHSWFGDVSEFVEEGQLDRIDALLTHKSVPKSFDTSREAAKWAVWLAYLETQRRDWEWGGFIYKGKDNKFLISKAFTSKQRTSVELRKHLDQYPAAVAWWHTHPDYSRTPDGYGSKDFSDDDHAFTRDMKKWAARKGRKDVPISGYVQVYTGRVLEESGSSDWHKTLVVSPEAEEDEKWYFYHSHLLFGGDPKRKETE